MIGFDKVMHFLLGVAVFMIAFAVGASIRDAVYMGVFVGVIKEAWDATGRGTLSFWDFAFTATGSISTPVWWSP